MHSPFSNSRLGTLRYVGYRHAYPGVADSVPTAREHLEEAARRGGLSCDLVDTAVLCLSELVTNAVTHAIGDKPRPRFVVAVAVRGRRQRYLRLEVYDPDSSTRPVFPPKDKAPDLLLEMDPECPSGRGLTMVAAMADKTGVETSDGLPGKTIWFELKLDNESGGLPPAVQEEAAVVVTQSAVSGASPSS